MAKQKLIILGTGGQCIDILDTMNEINLQQSNAPFECVGFLDDNKDNWGKVYFGVKVLGPLASAPDFEDCFFVNGIGSPNNFWKKKDIIAKAGIPLDRFTTLIHPSAVVSRMANIGIGTVLFQNVVVTSNAQVGNHIVVLPNSVISHDDIIGDYTSMAGGVCVSGGVTIGKSCYLGTNSAVHGNTIIGDYCLIGMGSVVLHNLEANQVVVGNPAKFLRKTVEDFTE